MSTSTTVSGLQIPENTDILNAQAAVGQLAQSLDTVCVPRFATSTDRDTAFAGGATEGQLCVVTAGSEAFIQKFNGSAWQGVEDRRWAIQTANVNITSTTATDLTGMVMSCVANGRYQFEVVVVHDGVTAGSPRDLAFTWTATQPVSGSSVYFGYGLALDTASRSHNINAAARGFPTSNFTVGVDNQATPVIFRGQFLVGSAATSIQLKAAQNVAGVETIVINGGDSFINYRRIG